MLSFLHNDKCYDKVQLVICSCPTLHNRYTENNSSKFFTKWLICTTCLMMAVTCSLLCIIGLLRFEEMVIVDTLFQYYLRIFNKKFLVDVLI